MRKERPRKGTKKGKAAGPRPELFNAPFRDLDKQLRALKQDIDSNDLKNMSAPLRNSFEDKEAFEREMQDVMPLAPDKKNRSGLSCSPKPPRYFRQEEDLEILAQLADLVSGYGHFDCYFSDEYIEGAVSGINPAILRKLRAGEFSYQDFLDLHGLDRLEARERVEKFLRFSKGKGYRCVLIVHGRGIHSEENKPVLKNYIQSWLCKGRIGRMVLAFSSARPCDGGTGSLYVLLRKRS